MGLSHDRIPEPACRYFGRPDREFSYWARMAAPVAYKLCHEQDGRDGAFATRAAFSWGVAMVNGTKRDGIDTSSEPGRDSPAQTARTHGRCCVGGVLLCGLLCLLTSCGGPGRRTAALLEEPPTSLQMISERAEGIIVAVPAQDWPRVYAYIKDIDNTWRDYKRPTITPSPESRTYPTGLLFGDLDAALAGLKDGAASRDAVGTIKAAGNVSGAAAELIGFCNPRRPSGIYRLALFERQIIVASTEGNLAAASTNLDRIRNTWGQVRATVFTHTGDVVVQGFDQLIAEQHAAIQANNPSRLAAGARSALQMINDMQQLNY